ncbi:MAG: TIGR04552 family protein [Deltaproteobacteria bacterium]|nr:TIGR04552 family protein [Deltaproteobacteria bacterium]MBW2256394.1 TIGR04552 family protein [Deltaproteobacteria bacterium]
MRRDILELDTSATHTYKELELTLGDVEALRLVLAGSSVIDWQRANFPDLAAVDHHLALLLIDVEDPLDRERLRFVYNEAVSYLEEQLRLQFPPELRNPQDPRQVFVWASETGGFRRRQILSCVILKLMHVIHHMEAADLKFRSAISEAELCDLAEARILRQARQMQKSSLPVVSFYGSRKTRNSVITKLIAKKETIAATIFDKLRFRLVVETGDDLVPALLWLQRNMFPFNYVIPAQSHNNLLDPSRVLEHTDQQALTRAQPLSDEPIQKLTGKNEFSGADYRMINFIADYPLGLPEARSPYLSLELGRVVFLMVEFQIVDVETARLNEDGENAHHLYKQRQYGVVAQRLKRGGLSKKERGKG